MRITTTLLCLVLAFSVHAQTTHELFVTDFEFNPAVIDAVQGDSLRIVPVDPGHTFTQVSEATWNANGDTPSGEFQFDPLVDPLTVALIGSGTIYYVCAPHAAIGMKGIVHVELASSIADHSVVRPAAFFPNPASDVIWMREPPFDAVSVSIVDAMGREAVQMQVISTEPLFVGDLPNGLYLVRVMDRSGAELQRQQLVVAR